ncbi:hypothetical protein QM806_04630 [Rhodococcus sp. IEGM 1351]|uniref:hypothetical protein n=1 Tax=Rhodococcus sp. IEGM 1351 TaxID=3047089 RepID=UPI0024B86F6E|nr:hypothetical protein [Rhodococcus sp. IEGM 1351]MDI9934741.1 hypothetical protein [Rhodococcus sp. IEGM 1351]
MGSHYNRGGSVKKQYLTAHAAREHKDWLPNAKNHEVNVYVCPQCKYYHVGRKPVSGLEIAVRKQLAKQDEYLYGRLIGALKAVLNREVGDA